MDHKVVGGVSKSKILERMEAPVLNSRYSYHAIFTDICKTRFNHLVTRLFVTSSTLEILVFSVLTKGDSSLIESLFLFTPKFVVLNIASLLIIVARKNYMHVQSFGYRNDITYVLGQVFSLKSLIFLAVYTMASVLVGLVLGGSVNISPAESIYSRLLTWCVLPFFYTVQHILFDRDRLSFSFDSQFQPPQEYITSKLGTIAVRSGILSTAFLLLHPFVFGFTSSTWCLNISTVLKLTFLSFIVFLNFEFINLGFDSHMSIGCLHKGKPISTLSSTPIETLIDGLRSKKPFTKLTAFQELSYRATAMSVSLRDPIYHTRYRNQNLWNIILKECIDVIEQSNTSVIKFLETLQNKPNKSKRPERSFTNSINDHSVDELFGNVPESMAQPSSLNYGITSQSFRESDHNNKLPLKMENILIQNKRTSNKKSRINQTDDFVFDHVHRYDEPIITHEPSIVKFIRGINLYIRGKLSSVFFPSGTKSKDEKLDLASIFDVFLSSKKRQADILVPLASCNGCAVVALMGFLVKSHAEDQKGVVVASVGEVLKVLERSVGVLGRFADWDPKSSLTATLFNKEVEQGPDAVSVLYNLCISAFLEIVLKYNALLNEVYLDDDVLRLSRWVLDICNTESM